jgi:hypothetical protein
MKRCLLTAGLCSTSTCVCCRSTTCLSLWYRQSASTDSVLYSGSDCCSLCGRCSAVVWCDVVWCVTAAAQGDALNPSGDVKALRAGWAVGLLERELEWAHALIRDTSVTDYQKQRRHATTYQLYITQAVIDLLRCNPAEAATSNTATTAAATTTAAAPTTAGASASAPSEPAPLTALLALQKQFAEASAACAVVPPTAFQALIAAFRKS